ncbi:hypothetical protein HK101_011096 [Irineochytrium annulatum]|nr:hypothetical protein HK101_011096 [Irineochytrium annulatum]
MDPRLFIRLIQTSIDAYAYANALFLASRFVAAHPQNAEAKYLLARCHYVSGDLHAALHVVKPLEIPHAKYLRGRVCLDMGRLMEGVDVLEELVATLEEMEGAGEPVDANAIFSEEKGYKFMQPYRATQPPPSEPEVSQNEHGSQPAPSQNASRPPLAPTENGGRVLRARPNAKRVEGGAVSKVKVTDEGRRSAKNRTSTALKSQTAMKSSRKRKGTESMSSEDVKMDEESAEVRAISSLLQLLREMGVAYNLYSQKEIDPALAALHKLDPHHIETGWVQSIIARAYFEKGDLRQAERTFRKLRVLEPYRHADMDLYSSTLWQLKQDVALAYLAHDLVDKNKKSPEAWCAMGNAFSIKQENDQAIKCFHRAIQLDPDFVYAHTLCGYEYLQIEDYEKSLRYFRTAMRLDPRHYLAWCMPQLALYLGLVNERKERHDVALDFFYEARRAMMPDPQLSTFRIANSLFLLGRCREAIEECRTIEDTDPPEVNVHFLMGKIYKKMGDHHMALRYFTKAQDAFGRKQNPSIKDEIGKVTILFSRFC